MFFLGLLASVFIFSVFQYLHNANVGYLDLAAPAHQEIVCKLPRAECRRVSDPVRCTVEVEDHTFWRGGAVDLNFSSPCPALPASMAGQTCYNPSLPLASVVGEAGLLHTVNSGVNPFKLWSILFLVLTSLLSLSIVIHDLALLEERLRPRILSIPNLRYATPCLWDCLCCARCRRCMQRLRTRRRCCWLVLVPLTLVVQSIVFMAVVYPFSLFVCLISPVRMSRMMVFLSGILCILWSVVFVLVTTLFDYQQYAVLWSTRAEEDLESCVCLCEFPLSRAVIIRIAVLGLGVCWHSLNFILRALKGLRRGQWANMFSVLYSVPIEAFPVVWERPNGAPLNWRTEGQAIQSEPAFDPFCLMDEQPESAWTRATLVPAVKTEEEKFIWEPYTGNMETEIGCCGFPRPARDDEDIWNGGSEVWSSVPEPMPPPPVGAAKGMTSVAPSNGVATQRGQGQDRSKDDKDLAALATRGVRSRISSPEHAAAPSAAEADSDRGAQPPPAGVSSAAAFDSTSNAPTLGTAAGPSLTLGSSPAPPGEARLASRSTDFADPQVASLHINGSGASASATSTSSERHETPSHQRPSMGSAASAGSADSAEPGPTPQVYGVGI